MEVYVKKNAGLFGAGLIIGMIIMGLIVWNVMPNMMLNVNKSKLDFEATVSEINESASKNGWMVPKVYDISKSLQKAGYNDVNRIKIISLCKPKYANTILKEDSNKKVTGIMPCRIGVYETKEGHVFMSEMNIGLMSKMFGGIIEEVMTQVAKEETEMFQHIMQE